MKKNDLTREMVRAQGVRQVRMRTSGASLKRLADGTLLIKPDEELKPIQRC